MDQKIDDGNPTYGILIANAGTVAVGDCTPVASCITAGQYISTDNNSFSCRFIYRVR
jgi:hypothetical protein